jgi:hypothetical protein
MATRTVLTEEQRKSASEDGHFVVEGVITPEECEGFLQRLDDYGHGRRPLSEGMSMQREPRVRRGELSAEPGADVRKIGGIGAGDDMFRALVLSPAIVDRMQELMSPNLKLFRADGLMKPAGVGSAKGMHQDSPYWPIEPMALWSCWMPFEPATLENGCMTAIPGSHRRGAQPHEHVTDDYVIAEEHYDASEVVAIPMEPGSGLFFHSLLMHATAENRSAATRRAITMSYMAAEYRYVKRSSASVVERPQPEYMRVSGVDVPGGV